MRGIIFDAFFYDVIIIQIFDSKLRKFFFFKFFNARKIKIEAFKKNNSQGKERIGRSIATKASFVFVSVAHFKRIGRYPTKNVARRI